MGPSKSFRVTGPVRGPVDVVSESPHPRTVYPPKLSRVYYGYTPGSVLGDEFRQVREGPSGTGSSLRLLDFETQGLRVINDLSVLYPDRTTSTPCGPRRRTQPHPVFYPLFRDRPYPHRPVRRSLGTTLKSETVRVRFSLFRTSLLCATQNPQSFTLCRPVSLRVPH